MDKQRRIELATSFVDGTGENIFLTGRAGTGKTTFLKSLSQHTKKRIVVVAPTGVAALNAAGVTIHSFFQFKPQLYIPGVTPMEFKVNREKRAIIRSLDMLVIDEVSMVRCDLMDAIDTALRHYRGINRPFGGVQLLLIGDVQQLSPVVRDGEWEHMAAIYSSPYFFDSIALRESGYISIELTHIFRQTDDHFIEILNACRDGRYDKVLFDRLNSRYIPGYQSEDGTITLTTHNYKANSINEGKMASIDAPTYSYEATVEGEFPENIYPCDFELSLKKGAQVMFIKNDTSLERLFYNGKIGRIVDIGSNFIEVECDDEGETIMVETMEWENSRYNVNHATKEIEREVIGRFRQYPLRSAWAITIHKSQGLTFDSAVIDVSGAFAYGQAYVALSRCRTLEGLVLSSPISGEALKSDALINSFSSAIEQNHPNWDALQRCKSGYWVTLVGELYDMSSVVAKYRLMDSLLLSAAAKVYASYCERWHTALPKVESDIEVISDRFVRKIKSYLHQDDISELEDRLPKGADYFTAQIEDVILPLIGDWDIELDNKENQKAVDNCFSAIKELLYHKIELLKLVEDGFTVDRYISRRAMLTFEKPKFKSIKNKSKSEDVKHPLLFEQLRLWRSGVAKELGQPAFVVASQKALISICELLPSNNKELKKAKGVGDKFIAKYGEQTLSIVERYCSGRGISQTLPLDKK